MKAILVMDMPKKCADCPCLHFNKYHQMYECRANINSYWENVDFEYAKGTKPDWCPLKPMPDKKVHAEEFLSVFIKTGYNACIDEILGGSEE